MTEDENIEDEELQDQRAEFARMLSSVVDASLSNLSLLSTQAWHHMGIKPLPGIDVSEMDLEQAKIAIDLYEANLNIVLGRLEADIGKELKRELMNLQMNFLNKSGK
ncbi:MAG: DUF1844 domain-containing protein [Candidatus Thermoplasmatota archaeon]|nr:DUF1844 domain-containing protein [Candidatus Thermoplasmatota archaeon]